MNKYLAYTLRVKREDFPIEDFSMNQGFRVTNFDPENLNEIEFTLPETEAIKLKALLESPKQEKPVGISLIISESSVHGIDNAKFLVCELTILGTDSSSDLWKYKCSGKIRISGGGIKG